MPSLADQLLTPDVQPQLVDGCVKLIEGEVADKRGFGGAAVKAGFAVVTRVKPGFVRDVVGKLMPDFVAALEPMYRESADAQGDAPVADRFVATVERERGRTAEALLEVTDRRIDAARPAVRRAYGKLRPTARDNVEAALPGLLATIRPFLH